MAEISTTPGPPMTLGNMRQQGVDHLIAFCHNDACRHRSADRRVEVSRRLDRCPAKLERVAGNAGGLGIAPSLGEVNNPLWRASRASEALRSPAFLLARVNSIEILGGGVTEIFDA